MKPTLIISFLAVLVFVPPWGVAQSKSAAGGSPPHPSSGRPAFLLDRSEEDWSFLRDESQRSDFWDPIKYVPLNREGTAYVTFGGEFRPFYEFYRNNSWGAGPQDDNGFFLNRFMFHADIHTGKRVRFFVEAKSGVEVNREGGPRPTDEDRLDVNQAFVDFGFRHTDDRPKYRLRIGRQEMNYGDGSLISFREGPNVRRGYDGAKFTFRTHSWQVDTFAAKPAQTKTGYFDDGPEPGQTLWGIFAASQTNVLPFFGRVEAYYIGLDRKRVRFDQGSARDQRHTLSVRTVKRTGNFEYEFAGTLQVGKFGDGDIRAWKHYQVYSYSFERARFRPLIGMNFAMSSGDKDPNDPDLQTFHPLFPKGLYYGYIEGSGSLNAIVLHPRGGLRLSKTVSLTSDVFFFWRQSAADGLYSQPGFFLRTGQQSSARFVGTLYQAELAWRPDRHTTIALQGARYQVGRFLLGTPPAKDLTYFSAKMSYKF